MPKCRKNHAMPPVRRKKARGQEPLPTVTKTPANLDASVITEPLDSLISAVGNKIEREWPARFANIQGARELFLLTVRIADVTSRSIRSPREYPNIVFRFPH